MNGKGEPSFLKRLRRYSLQGWYRYWRLKLFGRKLIVVGSCRMCGRCCRRISLEAGGRWLRSVADYQRLVTTHPDYGRFRLVDRDSQGFLLFSCDWYCRETGICRNHEERLDVCRQFPDPELYFNGGTMNPECGYYFREIVPFSRYLDTALQKNKEK